MITLTKSAKQAIKQQIPHPTETYLRVRLQSAGCCDPVLTLLVEKPAPDDHEIAIDGINLLVDKHTTETCGHITIDYSEKSWAQGFIITSEKPLSEWQGIAVCRINSL